MLQKNIQLVDMTTLSLEWRHTLTVMVMSVYSFSFFPLLVLDGLNFKLEVVLENTFLISLKIKGRV